MTYESCRTEVSFKSSIRPTQRMTGILKAKRADRNRQSQNSRARLIAIIEFVMFCHLVLPRASSSRSSWGYRLTSSANRFRTKLRDSSSLFAGRLRHSWHSWMTRCPVVDAKTSDIMRPRRMLLPAPLNLVGFTFITPKL